MPVLPKYQLKELFESGDLITQTTLVDLIDATYNEVLVAGANVTLNRVTTPSGTTVTINSATSANPTTYDLTSSQDGGNVNIILAGSDASQDVVQLTAGANITLTDNGSNGILIDSAGGITSYTNATPTPQNFPGDGTFDNIPTGSTFTNQTFTEMMDKMLYPELFPSLTNPHNAFASPTLELQEIGAVLTLNFTSTFNRGTITPAYTTNGYRSGLPNSYIYTGSGLVSSVPSTSLSNLQTVSNYTVLAGTQTWTSKVSYDIGEQPLSSKGNDYLAPLPVGTTGNKTKNIIGVYPPFATTLNIAAVSKQSLQTMNTTIQVNMLAEVIGGPKQTIDIPVAWSVITGLKQLNTLSNTWDSISLSTFMPTSTVTHEVPLGSGIFITYTRYPHNGNTIGARKLRFTT
jgi:hypothetical protein